MRAFRGRRWGREAIRFRVATPHPWQVYGLELETSGYALFFQQAQQPEAAKRIAG